jgi:hypothetical protein
VGGGERRGEKGGENKVGGRGREERAHRRSPGLQPNRAYSKGQRSQTPLYYRISARSPVKQRREREMREMRERRERGERGRVVVVKA